MNKLWSYWAFCRVGLQSYYDMHYMQELKGCLQLVRNASKTTNFDDQFQTCFRPMRPDLFRAR